MFERYTQNARRAIFFARDEAYHFNSHTIETQHLLLGLIREDKTLTSRFLRAGDSEESIRKEIEAKLGVPEKPSFAVDLPLSNECKRVAAYTAEEAGRLGHDNIGTDHLLLGLLREEKCQAAEILRACGLTLSKVRAQLVPPEPQIGQIQRDWATRARRRYWTLTAFQLALLIVFAVGLAKSTIAAKYLISAGAIWFGTVLAWHLLTPSSFFWSLGKHRILAKAISSAILSLFQFFMVGWLVPLGVGIYRMVRK